MHGILRACMIGMITVVVGLILVYYFFGLVGLFVIAALGILALASLKWLVVRGIHAAITRPFRAKSAVLRDAEVAVQRIAPISAPAEHHALPADEDDDPSGSYDRLDWFEVEVKVSPHPATGPFTYWEPGELALADENARSGMEESNTSDESDRTVSDVGVIGQVEIWQDGRWVEDEGYKVTGEQRLRLRIGVAPGHRRIRWRYYFEVVGLIEVPGRSDASTAVIDA